LRGSPGSSRAAAGGISAAFIVLLLLWLALAGALAVPAPGGGGKGAGPRREPITVVEVALPSRAALDPLVQAGYDVASVRPDRAVVYADDEELANLQAAGWALKVLVPPASSAAKALGDYHGYTNMTAMLDGYAAAYPALCRKLSLGKSVQNRDLWALKITTDPDLPQDKPRFRYLAAMHGNEAVGTELCLYLIDLLLKGYGSNDTRIVNLVRNVEIWIVPLVNPDGRESKNPRRYNANNYDLNRSFPEGSGTNLGNGLYGPSINTNGLQPEVRALMAWTTNHNFSLGANLHTGTVVVNYPYDNDNLGSVFSPPPDVTLFQDMARSYASNNPPMWANNIPPFTNGIVNGADWYAIDGGLQDWSYRYASSLEVTIELSDYQWPNPPASTLPTYWAQNRESMLAYMEWALRGVRGIIRDAQTGQPIRGAVRTEGVHHLVFSDASVGDYHRILLPGNYTLWFYAPGYAPQRVTNVMVSAGAATRLDVALQPVSARFAAKINFQPPAAIVPEGHRADTGAAFGLRAGGYSYGWETALAGGNLIERKAGRSRDLRYDTHCQMQAGGSHTWEIAVPNGPYSVLVAAGDPAYVTGAYRILAENLLLLSGAPSAANRWVEAHGTVIVTDGRLTLSNGPGAVSNRLAFVEINALEPATIEQWRAWWFGTTHNSGVAADANDADHDDLPNFLEYAFGLNPTLPESGWQLSPRVLHTNGTAWLACSFLRNTNATDLAFFLQAAAELPAPSWSNLASWTHADGWVGSAAVSETNAGPGRVCVILTDPQPIEGVPRRYLRLAVDRL